MHMPSDIHERLVGKTEEWLQRKGFSVGKPARTVFFKPDVLGCKTHTNGTCEEIMVEVETCSSLHNPHSIDQLQELDAEVVKRNKRLRTKASGFLVVPRKCVDSARFYIECEGYETISVKGF